MSGMCGCCMGSVRLYLHTGTVIPGKETGGESGRYGWKYQSFGH